ncbi:MAG TPA: DUF423 domain-containing protein [Bacteroidales bacterium]
MEKYFLPIGAFSAFIAVAAGAFGAHYLKNHLDAAMLTVFDTAVRYQMYHAFAIGLLSFSLRDNDSKWGRTAGWFFIAGTILFSGSLYLLSISGIKWIGAITPLGGLAFLAGWFSFAMHALPKNR